MPEMGISFSSLKRPTREEARELALQEAGDRKLTLVPVGPWILHDSALVADMARWRHLAREMFFAQFPESAAGMTDYLRRVSIGQDDAVLFMIEDGSGSVLGHLGLTQATGESAEVDSVMKGDPPAPRGTMTTALDTMIDWAFNTLGISSLRLKVASNNSRAIGLYERVGFMPEREIPLRRSEAGEFVEHREVSVAQANVDYTCLVMSLAAQSPRTK